MSPNYLTLMLLRGLVGVGLGGGPVVSAWFMEFVASANRGLWMVVISLFWTLGSILEASLAWVGSSSPSEHLSSLVKLQVLDYFL